MGKTGQRASAFVLLWVSFGIICGCLFCSCLCDLRARLCVAFIAFGVVFDHAVFSATVCVLFDHAVVSALCVLFGLAVFSAS